MGGLRIFEDRAGMRSDLTSWKHIGKTVGFEVLAPMKVLESLIVMSMHLARIHCLTMQKSFVILYRLVRARCVSFHRDHHHITQARQRREGCVYRMKTC
jgi:hypothetical protein